MWSLPRKDGDLARLLGFVFVFSGAPTAACGGIRVVGCSWESPSDDGREEGGTEACEEVEEEEGGKGSLADAARASPLRISVVSGEVDRARIQGAA